MLIIDAANVIGSRPTGWWCDRPAATQRFTERVRATANAGALTPPMTLVLEGQARTGVEQLEVDGVAVVHATGSGDDTIATLAESHGDVVVTADRQLAKRVRALSGDVVGRLGCLTASSIEDQAVDWRSAGVVERPPRPPEHAVGDTSARRS